MGLLGSDEPDNIKRGGFKTDDSIAAIGKRVIDEEAGVVIYAAKCTSVADGYGLAAVPIEDTDLNISNE